VRRTLAFLVVAALALAQEPGVAALVAGAVEQVGRTPGYDPSYRRIAYPGGDVAFETGVCTDVVVRAFRRVADVQRIVAEAKEKAGRPALCQPGLEPPPPPAALPAEQQE